MVQRLGSGHRFLIRCASTLCPSRLSPGQVAAPPIGITVLLFLGETAHHRAGLRVLGTDQVAQTDASGRAGDRAPCYC